MTELEDADCLRISISVSDMVAVRDVLNRLAEVDATVEPQGMSVINPSEATIVEVDAGPITPKQQEAFELAYRSGYYRRPREADLGDLARELEISRSAVSQRLRTAEARLVTEFLSSVRPWLVASESAWS